MITKEDRLYKLSQGSDTAVWAHGEIVSQDKRITELEKERDIRDLEQQAKGIVEFMAECKDSLDWDWSMISAYELFDMMRIRSKELKEQGE